MQLLMEAANAISDGSASCDESYRTTRFGRPIWIGSVFKKYNWLCVSFSGSTWVVCAEETKWFDSFLSTVCMSIVWLALTVAQPTTSNVFVITLLNLADCSLAGCSFVINNYACGNGSTAHWSLSVNTDADALFARCLWWSTLRKTLPTPTPGFYFNHEKCEYFKQNSSTQIGPWHPLSCHHRHGLSLALRKAAIWSW